MKIDTDTDHPTGILLLRVMLRGQVIEESSGSNLVLDARRTVNSRLLGGVADPITKIGFGSGTAAPELGNTSLTDAVLLPIGGVTFPASGQVQFAFTLGTGDANGLAISEFGLLTTSGILYARKVRGSPLNKTNEMSISGVWKITY